MDGPTLILLIFLGLTVIAGLALSLGWGFFHQLYRDTKAKVLKAERRERLQKLRNQPAKSVPVNVPSIVRNTTPAAPMSQRPYTPAAKRRSAAPAVQAVTTVPEALIQSAGRYTQAKSLLTKGEQAFYLVLREALGTKYHISMKPRLADLVNVRGGQGFYKAFNQISAKHIDFVLANPQTLAPILLVELDDVTHRRYVRKQRDKLVNNVCAEAGLKIVHIKARMTYDVAIVRHIIEDRLQRR